MPLSSLLSLRMRESRAALNSASACQRPGGGALFKFIFFPSTLVIVPLPPSQGVARFPGKPGIPKHSRVAGFLVTRLPFSHPHTERRKRAIHTLTSGTVAHGATSHVSPTDPYPRVPNPAHDERAGPTAPPRTSSLSCTICPLARHSLACVAFGFNPGAWRPTRALGRPSRRFQSSPRGHYSAPCSAWP